MEYSIGIFLALLICGIGNRFMSNRLFYPVMLVVIASCYVIFAVISFGKVPIVELLTFFIFIFIALAGFKINFWLLVIGFAAHGIFDLFHHRVIDISGAPLWWPGFCLVFDFTVALIVSARLIRTRAPHAFLGYFFIALILSSSPAGYALAQTREAPSFDQELLQWMKANVSPQTGMPFSFEVLGNKKDVYGRIGVSFSTTGIIERMIVDQGVSLYDAALWQMALSATGDSGDLAMARKPFDYYWQGTLKDFYNIRSGSGQQIFVYDPAYPELVTSDLSGEGRRGFIFRILNANGLYLANDPLDAKAFHEDFPNNPRIHWEDWKPIAGENAWVVLASLHLFKKKPPQERTDTIELKLAEELARAALILQAGNGGIRMAPLGTYYHLIDVPSDLSEEEIARRLDERAKEVNHKKIPPEAESLHVSDREYPDYHRWYYEEISTENNLSWYAAFRMLYQLTGKEEYRDGMKRIEGYFQSVWDPEENVFYQGAHFKDGAWTPNEDPFAVDVQNWSLVVIGPKQIDEWFGEGAAYGVWRATKLFSGVPDEDGNIKGIGFTKENDRVSIEWTAGAILAGQKIATYYASSHPKWTEEIEADTKSLRAGIDEYRFQVKEGVAAYSYSSRRGWIPFGWYSHEPEVLSLASTAWVFLIDANVNPFE